MELKFVSTSPVLEITAFNRTNVELKSGKADMDYKAYKAFNRTNVELKS